MTRKKSQDKISNQKALVPIKKKTGEPGQRKKRLPTYALLVRSISYWPFHFEFKSPDVRRIFGIKKERLREWIKFGYIEPSVKKSSGPGTDNVFSTVDLFNSGLFKNLIDLGMNRWIASQWTLSLEEKDWTKVNDRKAKFLVIGGKIDRNKDWKESITVYSSKKVPEAKALFDFALIMNLENIIENVKGKFMK